MSGLDEKQDFKMEAIRQDFKMAAIACGKTGHVVDPNLDLPLRHPYETLYIFLSPNKVYSATQRQGEEMINNTLFEYFNSATNNI